MNAIFAHTAIVIELLGISLNMYFYPEHFVTILGVPIIVIAGWVVIGHASWIIYTKFGWIGGLLTGLIIDLPLEFLAFHLGWWTWIPNWSPALFFNAPALNFAVYLSVSCGSILTYKYTMKPQLQH
jgi:hypothetical protein